MQASSTATRHSSPALPVPVSTTRVMLMFALLFFFSSSDAPRLRGHNRTRWHNEKPRIKTRRKNARPTSRQPEDDGQHLAKERAGAHQGSEEDDRERRQAFSRHSLDDERPRVWPPRAKIEGSAHPPPNRLKDSLQLSRCLCITEVEPDEFHKIAQPIL